MSGPLATRRINVDGTLALQRKVTRNAGFQPARAATKMQARCLRYNFKTTLRCSVRTATIEKEMVDRWSRDQTRR